MKKRKYKIVTVLVALICIIALWFGFLNKKNTQEGIEQETQEGTETIQLYDMTQEEIEELETKEIPVQTYEQEVMVSAEQEVEDEGFELQGEIAYNGTTEYPNIALGNYQGLTYYSQIDNRWRNHPYTSTGNSSQTIGTSGCGPACAAMVVTSTRGTITPERMGDLFVQYGYRSANSGTYWSAFRWTADVFDIGYQETSSLDTAVSLLRNNNYVIASVGNGLFTTGGHIIVIVGIEGNMLQIYDPYLYSGKFDTSTRKGKVTVSGNTVYCSIDNFRAYANYKGFFAYKAEETTTTTNSQYSPGSYEVTATVLNVRADATTNSRVVTKLYTGSKQGVDYTVGVWGHLMNNAGWICLDYCRMINTPQSINTQYSPGSYEVTASVLNVRADATTNSRVVTKLYRGSKQGVDYTVRNWGHLMNNAGWISLEYCRIF